MTDYSFLFKDTNKWQFPLTLGYNTPEVNAFSYPAHRPQTGGQIVFGPKLLEQVYNLGAGLFTPSNRADQAGLASVTFVVAHEFAHQIQFNLLNPLYDCYLAKNGNPKTNVAFELEADAIAGAWLKSEYAVATTDDDIAVTPYLFRKLGSSDFTAPQFHGHMQQRYQALMAGWDAVPKGFALLTTNILDDIHKTIMRGQPPQFSYNEPTKLHFVDDCYQLKSLTAQYLGAGAGRPERDEINRAFSSLLGRPSLNTATALIGPNGENEAAVSDAIYSLLQARKLWTEYLSEASTETNAAGHESLSQASSELLTATTLFAGMKPPWNEETHVTMASRSSADKGILFIATTIGSLATVALLFQTFFKARFAILQFRYGYLYRVSGLIAPVIYYILVFLLGSFSFHLRGPPLLQFVGLALGIPATALISTSFIRPRMIAFRLRLIWIRLSKVDWTNLSHDDLVLAIEACKELHVVWQTEALSHDYLDSRYLESFVKVFGRLQELRNSKSYYADLIQSYLPQRIENTLYEMKEQRQQDAD